MSEFKLYLRKLGIPVRARVIEEGETLYNAAGHPFSANPGDMLIDTETDRYVMDRTLFEAFYQEMPSADRE